MKKAIGVGNKKDPPYNFGAVVVKDGVIIAADFNHVHEFHDPTAHAETSAMRAAAQKLQNHNLEGCTLYGSHEPCLMCFSCAAWSRIDRIVYANPASEVDGFSYEFNDVSLKQLSRKLATRKIKIELIRVV